MYTCLHIHAFIATLSITISAIVLVFVVLIVIATGVVPWYVGLAETFYHVVGDPIKARSIHSG